MRILPHNSNTNVITIEKNVPIPVMKAYKNVIKYNFLKSMEVGDSFYINGNTPDFTPSAVRSHVYGINANRRNSYRYTIRTTTGISRYPASIRVWRIK